MQNKAWANRLLYKTRNCSNVLIVVTEHTTCSYQYINMKFIHVADNDKICVCVLRQEHEQCFRHMSAYYG